MKRKEMIYNPQTQRYEERYVDMGKGRALPRHGIAITRNGKGTFRGVIRPPRVSY